MCYWCEIRKSCVSCGKPLQAEKPTSSCMVDSVVRLSEDGTEKLCKALYGRSAKPRDYIGGANARMLHDAADMINSFKRNAANEPCTERSGAC